ncbi:ORF MSV052 putative vaccina A23R homolog, similar to SW:P20998 [Melanoplus sanguinipes entomopoxvirus]|uniref:ORF MSV052 putative vaccina A23R homolog, similar to SW:P20998 n=1 Tax=Melanoplus sanguinipes entomopoxvirus TaxID=83191 RepID=Q9YW40_MSEPV|nr:ORF MSV052 putative vaccina A23R homolog, similar to SW:P20998 [Melanoplus sanguinipes entomopoxvirus]AAC97825.1 ORF MSV052 putative vaccina A23R homolog, similar to SW:P20998 [Melanoplus sanguinipes entomopoxvirus 'O']
MNELYEIKDIAYKNSMKRTIINYIFSIDGKKQYNLFNNIKKDILENNIYDNLKLNKINYIDEIKSCIIDKNCNKIFMFININNLTPILYKGKPKNVKINIINEGYNSKKIEYHILNNETSFDQYILKKKNKKGFRIKLLNEQCTENYKKMYKNTYYEIENTYDNITKNLITHYKLILQLDNDKIITEGRLLLPNSISISLKNRSRIIIYANHIQVIVSKQKNETLDTFNNQIKDIMLYFKIIYELYCLENIYLDDIFNLRLYCDFHLFDSSLIYPINTNNKQIRFFGKGKLNIQSIHNVNDIINIVNEIKIIKNKSITIYKKLMNIDPFNSNIEDIYDLIDKEIL